MKSLVNKLERCFWSQSNCDLISTSNLCFLFDVTNSITDAIKILIICLQDNNPITSFSLLVHIGYKIIESKKMELSIIHEILPPEIVEKILKLLDYSDIYQAQLVCRRWKKIIDLGNLAKKSHGKCLKNTFFCIEIWMKSWFLNQSNDFRQDFWHNYCWRWWKF